MKNISLAINAVLLVAVGVLYYLHFSSQKANAEEDNTTVQAANFAIAYINADSLLTNYEFIKDKQKQLEEKGQKFEREYQNRATGLQRELNEYQQNIGNLTIGQAKALEEDLIKKQQNLRMYQESLTQQLMQEEAKINQELYEKVSEYLRDYSQKNNLQLVVKYNQGSDILYASDSMDITTLITSGLNEQHGLAGEIAKDSTAQN